MLHVFFEKNQQTQIGVWAKMAMWIIGCMIYAAWQAHHEPYNVSRGVVKSCKGGTLKSHTPLYMVCLQVQSKII